jgi:hypothetical protein
MAEFGSFVSSDTSLPSIIVREFPFVCFGHGIDTYLYTCSLPSTGLSHRSPLPHIPGVFALSSLFGIMKHGSVSELDPVWALDYEWKEGGVR